MPSPVTDIETERPVASRRRLFIGIFVSFAVLLMGFGAALIIVRTQLVARKQRLDQVARQHGITLTWRESIPWGRRYDRFLKPLNDFVGAYFHEVFLLYVGETVDELPPSFLADLSHYDHLDDLHWHSPYHSADVARLLAHQQSLSTLALVTKNLQDCDLESIPQFAQLKTLAIDGLESNSMSGRFLRTVVKHSPRLKELVLHDIRLDDEACDAIGKLASLQFLDLSGCQLTTESVKSWAKLSALQHLVVAQATVDDRFTAAIGSLPALTILHAKGCSLTSESARSLARLPGLKNLDVDDTAVNDQFGATLGALSKLEILHVKGTALSARGLHDLEHCRALRLLRTGGKPSAPLLLAHLRHCVWLRNADIVWSGHFTETQIASFNALPDLTYLYFSDIGDTEASHLLQCPQITGLDIHSDRLTLNGIHSLMQMVDLHYLKLAGKVWGPELVDVLYESPTLEYVKILNREWKWWEFEDLREKLGSQPK